jgi:hypothetical protein
VLLHDLSTSGKLDLCTRHQWPQNIQTTKAFPLVGKVVPISVIAIGGPSSTQSFETVWLVCQVKLIRSTDTTLEALNDRDVRIANQAGQQTINGGQYIYL